VAGFLRHAWLCLLLAGAVTCSREPALAPQPEPEPLRLAVRADVTGFFPNPPTFNESYTIAINSHVFEGLVSFDPRLRIQPALAERWENPDDRTYVFDLRPGLRFSDGRPVAAQDVAASLTAARARGWFNRDYLQAIESVRVVGPRRLEIRVRPPYLILLSKLRFGLVVPRDSVGAAVVPTIGTGPYKLESWEPGRGFVLARNPHFRGPAAAYQRARFEVVPDSEERVAKLLRGEADVIDQVPLEWLERLRRREDLTVVSGPGLRVLCLGLRVDAPPFSDPRVREAIDLAIDRDELVARALDGLAQPASQIVPSAVVGHNQQIPVTRPSRERARRLLAEAGAQSLKIRLDGPDNRYPRDREILLEVARQLAEVGIQVEVNARDKQGFYALLASHQSRFFLAGFSCQTGEAGDVLDSLLHSPREGGLGANNYFGVADPELDRLIDEGNASHNLEDRAARLKVAIRRATELRAALPLVVQTEAVAFSRRVEWPEPPVDFALRVQDMRPAR
jgi:peptide/nickel transport system substrate-binding protein